MINKNNFNIDHFHKINSILKKKESNNKERQTHLREALTHVNIEGMVLEFGVYQGKTIEIIASHFSNNTIWGFDSFEGLPEDWFTKLDKSTCKFKKGRWAVDQLPIVSNNVNLIKGFYKDSVPPWIKNVSMTDVKFIHIDCDLYSSTKEVLTFLNDYIVPGTVIVFDEFYPWSDYSLYETWEEHEYKALKEWIEKFDREFSILHRSNYQQCSIKIIK
jgi:hypothetical protein